MYKQKLLKRVLDIFNKHNVAYWIDYGTLLGAIRDKDIIPWDHDADISFIMPDAHSAICGCLHKIVKLPSVQHIRLTYHGGVKILLCPGLKWHIDIYPWRCRNNNKFYESCIPGFGMPEFPAYEIEEIIQIEFLGLQVRVPKKFQKRLARLYGPNYLKPQKPSGKDGSFWMPQQIQQYLRRYEQIKQKV